MGQALTTLPRRGFGETSRTDLWWLKPLLVFLGLSAFIVYSTWAALQNAHFEYEGYLSPMYSPLFFSPEGIESHHALFESLPGWWPAWLPLFPAFLILWAPGGFRFTCYYYRGAYYKSFWGSPVNCSVGKAQKGYRGEKLFPLVFQNLHRFFLYFALIFLLILSYDVYRGMFFSDGAGGTEFGIGVGTLVLALNVILLGGYTLGCHSLRHLVGGRLNILSRKPARLKAWQGVTWCNVRHQLFAWLSLFWVGFTDFYVRMCSMGVWPDVRIL
ncbi:MAG: succinate dehydrogenase [Gemmatimonadetes bacterium]|nr:succinate dehydrogenase [Gemmatimonadota bacterium]